MKYEITLLVAEEAEVEPIKKLLESLNGKVVEEQKWGKKQLSYPIKKNMDAYYFTWSLEMEPKKMAEFKRGLNFNESLLRYLLLKVD
jgi:small subunit ribosomal protein S6